MTSRERGTRMSHAAISNRMTLRTEIAITADTRRTIPITRVPVPTNFRRSSSRRDSGDAGFGAGALSVFPPAAGAASSAIEAAAVVAHLNVANGFGFGRTRLGSSAAQSLYRARLFQRPAPRWSSGL